MDFTVDGLWNVDPSLLRGLELSGLALDFDHDVAGYAVSAPLDAAVITVRATAAVATSRAVIEPADADAATDGHQVAVELGENTITALVYSPEGELLNTYTVVVTVGFLPEGCELRDLDAPVATGTWASGCASLYHEGSYAHYYLLALHERSEVGMQLQSADPSHVALRSANGTELAHDGGSDNRDAQLTRTLDAGTYVIETLSHGAGQEGDYTLTVSGDDRPAGPVGGGAGAAAAVDAGSGGGDGGAGNTALGANAGGSGAGTGENLPGLPGCFRRSGTRTHAGRRLFRARR